MVSLIISAKLGWNILKQCSSPLSFSPQPRVQGGFLLIRQGRRWHYHNQRARHRHEVTRSEPNRGWATGHDQRGRCWRWAPSHDRWLGAGCAHRLTKVWTAVVKPMYSVESSVGCATSLPGVWWGGGLHCSTLKLLVYINPTGTLKGRAHYSASNIKITGSAHMLKKIYIVLKFASAIITS